MEHPDGIKGDMLRHFEEMAEDAHHPRQEPLSSELFTFGGLCMPPGPLEHSFEWSLPRRDFYGLAEIATALYVKRKKVAKWYRKGRLPKPTDVLATGPIWSAEAIDAFLHPPLKPLRDVLPRFSAERGGIRFAMPPRRGTD